MKKYMFKRILFSLFSLFVVVMVVMLLVYSLIERSVIFQQDDTWNKRSNNERTVYEYTQYQKYGYLNYSDFGMFLRSKYYPLYGETYNENQDYIKDFQSIQNKKKYLDNKTVQEFIEKYEGEGYNIVYLEPLTYSSGNPKPGGRGFLLAVREKSVFVRFFDYLKGFISIETTKDVTDEELTERYIRIEKDPYSKLPALVGSGTNHKYLIYFDDHFPFIHQNIFHINLGTSFTTYRGQEIVNVITESTGGLLTKKQQFPTMVGTDQYADTAINFHSLTYNYGILSDIEKAQFKDKYTVYTYYRDGMSMMGNSFVIGIIATLIAYLIGIPIGMLMSRNKDRLIDHLGNAYIIFITAVPSLAYIFMFAAIGTTIFKLPYKFANAQVKILAFILPTISLAMPQLSGLMKWMRRYMIDQMNSDYVKFARAEGLSESEIFNIHISKNAFIYLVHGIPGNILGCLTGAIITERVYGVPGVGRLLTDAITKKDNGVIVGVTLFYTALSIISQILGDLLLTKYDPRISLSEDSGGGR